MNKNLLTDSSIILDNNYLKQYLEKSIYNIYTDIITFINNDLESEYNWKFYNDGKCWLCKVFYKRKTICWISLWENFIKFSFHFNSKNYNGVFDLNISEENKKAFKEIDKNQRSITMIFDIYSKSQIKDVKEVMKYKKSSK